MSVLTLLAMSYRLDAFKIEVNPLLPSAANMRRSAKIFILIKEEIIKKISYERRDHESVDEKKRKIPEKLQKNISGSKGLKWVN